MVSIQGIGELTARHRAARRNDWSQVLLTDESHFSLERGTRRGGTRNNPIFVQVKLHCRRGGLMVIAGIRIGIRTDLHIFQINGSKVCRQDPKPTSCAVAIGDSFLLMQDNSTPYTARLVESFLKLK
ncbi:hypothetical protein TNCV_4086101 [Trichonephila clavipes]|nr:hypothetical protein TNCV_4086101 [Trichonephila clavipes]